MPSAKLEFTGHGGDTLAARFDTPDGPLKAVALFAHCFTCSKDLPAARRTAPRRAGPAMGIWNTPARVVPALPQHLDEV